MRMPKLRMNRYVRVLFTILGICLFFFGILGFAYMFTASRGQTGKFDDQKPLHSVNGVAVDSKGNLYYGNNEYNSIQVYDNTGSFLYRFSFPTESGFYTFYIDGEDVIHIAAATAGRVFTFQNGDLLSEHEYADGQEEADAIDKFERLRVFDYVDEKGNRYIIKGKTVEMYDPAGTFVRKILPEAPVWPFSIFMFWGSGAVGMLLIFIMNIEFFISLHKALNHKPRPAG